MSGTEPNGFGFDRLYGLTTILLQPGTTKVNGQMPGYIIYGATNYPAQSVHTGGSHVLMGDGSVRLISDNINFATFQMLLTRDDGQVVGEF